MGVIVAAVIVIYALISVFFHFHFFPGTEINGYKCGFHSVGKVKEMIEKGVGEYTISITERDDKKESVASSDVGLTFVDDGRLEKIKEGQKAYAWITFPFINKKYSDGVTLEVDETSYENAFNGLNAFDENQVVAPVDAWSQYNEETNSYDIVDEIYGNTVKRRSSIRHSKRLSSGRMTVLILRKPAVMRILLIPKILKRCFSPTTRSINMSARILSMILTTGHRS